jgi:hypothetical protein
MSDGADLRQLLVGKRRHVLIEVRHPLHPGLSGKHIARAVSLGEIAIDLFVNVQEGIKGAEFGMAVIDLLPTAVGYSSSVQ